MLCSWKVVGHDGNTKHLGQFMSGPLHLEPAQFVGVEEVRASGFEETWVLMELSLRAVLC